MKLDLLFQVGSVVGLFSAVSGTEPKTASFVKRVVEKDGFTPGRILSRHLEVSELEIHPNFRRRHVSLVGHPSDSDHPSDRRQSEEFEKEENCDQALLKCLPEDNCAECFRFLYSSDIDWANISPTTGCDEVTTFLAEKGYCADMHNDATSKGAFCASFDACAVWEVDEMPDDDDFADLDCDALTECDWPGMYKAFIGDGICHDGMGGCYNTAICGYDGGDCCEDTCQAKNRYADCGHDDYACRDPNSTSCDPVFTLACKHNTNIPDENNPDPSDTKCLSDEVKYRLVMYDSFGDGWDQTAMTITPTNRKSDIKYNGGLESGSMGSRYICLPSASTCIHVDVSGGEWGNEASWEIKPMTNGAPALGAGGAPMSCDFSVGGDACENTCDGKANLEPNTDPDYKEFKEMYNCIEEKCTIQVGVCQNDDTCSMCLSEDKADFCYGSDAFLAVVDCTMCKCTDRKDSDFCHEKLSPGLTPVNPNGNGNGRLPDGSPRECSPSETMKGSNAVLTFANCTLGKFDQVSMLVTNYDENSFGALDQFESCSHSFASAADHGGHTALSCMQILVNAVNYGETDDENAGAIAALAGLLYRNAGEFCECSAAASADCPLCSSFIHIKTLLYESLDACQSLDEIDCDAWTEFYKPCQSNLNSQFGSVDFTKDGVCDFVHNGCGGAGPFPAFRRLDCGEDAATSTSKVAWEFYKQYSGACLTDDDGDDKNNNYQPVPDATPRPTPRPTIGYVPTAPKPPPTPRPTTKYVPSGGDTSSNEYKPYEPDSSSGSSSGEKTSHRLRNFFIFCAFGAVGFVYYKRQNDAFSFVRYRNTRNYAGGESEMYSASYSGLTMDSGSGQFQPPTLPPTPAAMDGSMM